MTKLTLSESFDLVPSPLFWAAAANVQWGENIFENEFEYTPVVSRTFFMTFKVIVKRSKWLKSVPPSFVVTGVPPMFFIFKNPSLGMY